MSFLTRLPRFSLFLLFTTYLVFGWIFSSQRSWHIWALEAALIVIIGLILIAPITLLKLYFRQWLSSDIKAFLTIVLLSISSVFILRWINLSIHILLLLSASSLSRLDLQTLGYNGYQCFFILCITSLLGLGSGFALRLLIFAPVR